MTDVGKILVVVGLSIVVLGGLLWLGGKANLPLGRLPGDIRIERGNFKFYFPLMTSIVLSVILSLVFYLFGRIGR